MKRSYPSDGPNSGSRTDRRLKVQSLTNIRCARSRPLLACGGATGSAATQLTELRLSVGTDVVDLAPPPSATWAPRLRFKRLAFAFASASKPTAPIEARTSRSAEENLIPFPLCKARGTFRRFSPGLGTYPGQSFVLAFFTVAHEDDDPETGIISSLVQAPETLLDARIHARIFR